MRKLSEPPENILQKVASWKSNSSINDSSSSSNNSNTNKVSTREKPHNITLHRASSKSLGDPDIKPSLSRKFKLKSTHVYVTPKI